MSNPRSTIICAGLNCLDLQLIGCTQSGNEEAIEQYQEAVYCAGGSALQTATALAKINPKDEQIRTIRVLTKIGKDRNGEILMDFMTEAGVDTRLALVDRKGATAMAVLPIFQNGKRGCYFNLASNNSFTKEELLSQLEKLMVNGQPSEAVDAFLFGYPHLMPQLQGENLKSLLESTKQKLGEDALIGMDLNGVNADNHGPTTIGPGLPFVDVLHLNEEEAEIIFGKRPGTTEDAFLRWVAHELHHSGCAVVVLSLGSKGAFLSVTPLEKRLAKCPNKIRAWGVGSQVRVPAFAIPKGRQINTNGAGDALFAGFCWAASQELLTLEQAGQFAALVARQRCDATTRDTPTHNAQDLLDLVLAGNLPAAI